MQTRLTALLVSLPALNAEVFSLKNQSMRKTSALRFWRDDSVQCPCPDSSCGSGAGSFSLTTLPLSAVARDERNIPTLQPCCRSSASCARYPYHAFDHTMKTELFIHFEHMLIKSVPSLFISVI